MTAMAFTLVAVEHAEPGLVRRLAEIDAALPSDYTAGYETPVGSVAEREARLTENIGSKKALVLTARGATEELIGFHWVCLVEGNETCAYVNSTWVHPDYRKRGIGSRLKDEGERWARERGATHIAASVALRNNAMIEFNRRRGYAPTTMDMLKKL